MSQDDDIIAVIGATGRQGGGVVRALQAQGKFRVRALTRNPGKHEDLAAQVVLADLERPETLADAFEGAHGVFVVTNFWEGGGGKVDEVAQCRAAVEAARAAGVRHFVWSSLPDVDTISKGKFHVPHFTDKARANAVVRDAGFAAHTVVEAPFYFQNLTSVMAPQPQDDGTRAWALPIDPAIRCIHMGDIDELGKIVAGAFANPEKVGSGQVLSLCGTLASFDDVVACFREQGHKVVFNRIPSEVFAQAFPGADEMAQMLAYFEEYTYMGPDAESKVALANEIATGPITELATWVRANVPAEERA